jgi:hypothetical protein
MPYRRIGLLAALAAFAVLGPRGAMAQGATQNNPAPGFQTEGRNTVTFSVPCATATWTLIIASDTISRSTFLQSISSNTNTICLLPETAGAVPTVAISSQCTTNTQGPELSPISALTDYSHSAWWCASSSGTATNTIKGYRTRDKGDYGNIGALGDQ